jgi:hypothetical protein
VGWTMEFAPAGTTGEMPAFCTAANRHHIRSLARAAAPGEGGKVCGHSTLPPSRTVAVRGLSMHSRCGGRS